MDSVRQVVNYEFSFYSDYDIIPDTDYVVFRFPPEYFDSALSDYYTNLYADPPAKSLVVFPKAHTIYYKPSIKLNKQIVQKIVIGNLNNPSYSMDGTFNIIVYSIIGGHRN